MKFAVEPGAAAEKLGAGVSAVIWTTTPWTLPHNRALAFHPDYDYVVAETSAGALLLAADLVGPALDALKLEAASVRGPWKGKDLAELKFKHPFLDLVVPAVLADYVTLDQGTGIVHTAPGHGVEDFQTGQKYGIEAYAPIDDHGRYLEGLPEYKGKTVFEANPIVVHVVARSRRVARRTENLAQLSALLALPQSGDLPRHRAVVHRSRRTREATAAPIRPRALAEIAKVKWTPEWGAAANSLDDRGAAGLVRFAATLLGRAAGDSVLQ